MACEKRTNRGMGWWGPGLLAHTVVQLSPVIQEQNYNSIISSAHGYTQGCLSFEIRWKFR